MKVLFINDLYPPNIKGGGEISTHLIAKGLAEQGINVKVLTIGKERQEYEYEGVNVETLKPQNIYWSYKSNEQTILKKAIWHLQTPYLMTLDSRVLEVIREFKPDIVETSVIEEFSDRIWHILKNENIKIVHTLRSYSQLCYNSNMFKDGENCSGRCTLCTVHSFPKKILSKYVDAVIGISQFILDKHLKYGYFENADKYVIPNIYETKANLDENKHAGFKFGYIGRLHPTKGVELLIDSFKEFYDQHIDQGPSVSLEIAGDGNLDFVKSLKERSKGYPINFIGFTSPNDYYEQIDISVCPSVWEEPFGRVVIESMAHGVPVIGSVSGGIEELINPGITGFLFKKGSKLDLVEKLQQCFKNKEILPIIKKNCIEKSKHFSSSNVIKEHLSVLENILK